MRCPMRRKPKNRPACTVDRLFISDSRTLPADLRQWGALLDAGARALADANVPMPRRAARWLLEGILGICAASLIGYPEQEASVDEVQRYSEAIRRCRHHEPLQYVLGHAEFGGLRLRMTSDVLIPRPETEILVQVALACVARFSNPRVLDVGTGSGCIALALKHARSDAHVVAYDISRAALRVAAGNARRLGLAVSFVHADILASTQGSAASEPLDLIVSNPPYVPDAEFGTLPANVRDFEPVVALVCGDDPLRFYRAIARQRSRLRPGGNLVLEVHADYAAQVRQLLMDSGFSATAVHLDLAGRPRIVTGVSASN